MLTERPAWRYIQGREGSMTKKNRAFAIDDTIDTSDNLAVYTQFLVSMDAPLGTALSSSLASLAAGQQVDIVAVWDALYAATAPAPAAPLPNQPRDSDDGAEGAA
jgi:hypothetical protein